MTPFKHGYPLFILALFLITKTKYKDKFDVKLTLVIANCLLLFSSFTIFLYLFYELFFAWYAGNMYESYAFASRSGISYKLYFILLAVAIFIPFIFLFKKLRESILCSFVVAFIIALSLNIEKITTFIVSLHRDYLPSKWVHYYTIPEKIFLNPLTQTVLFAIIVAITYRIKKRN